ncbi:MAG: type II toxin-antitoxin system RelE/ParE family toxin [Saprospiraceae bacterium]|nr:type II toxin-antitoxin system RelE/ParE family toxin [Saprospiraceae bacterium]
MAKIVFTNKAKQDLQQIWNYTYDTWSEKQADKYFEDIIARCNNLEYNFERGKDYSKLIPNLKGVKCNRHIIFYRILAQQVIEIARILHEEMDIENHLIN